MGSIPGWETKILHVLWHSQKHFEKERKKNLNKNNDKAHMLHLLNRIFFCFSVFSTSLLLYLQSSLLLFFSLLYFSTYSLLYFLSPSVSSLILMITSQIFVEYSSLGVCLILSHDYIEVVYFLDRYNIELMLCPCWYSCQEVSDVCPWLVMPTGWLGWSDDSQSSPWESYNFFSS